MQLYTHINVQLFVRLCTCDSGDCHWLYVSLDKYNGISFVEEQIRTIKIYVDHVDPRNSDEPSESLLPAALVLQHDLPMCRDFFLLHESGASECGQIGFF